MAKWLNMPTHKAGIVSPSPPCITIEIPVVSARFEIEYATNDRLKNIFKAICYDSCQLAFSRSNRQGSALLNGSGSSYEMIFYHLPHQCYFLTRI